MAKTWSLTIDPPPKQVVSRMASSYEDWKRQVKVILANFGRDVLLPTMVEKMDPHDVYGRLSGSFATAVDEDGEDITLTLSSDMDYVAPFLMGTKAPYRAYPPFGKIAEWVEGRFGVDAYDRDRALTVYFMKRFRYTGTQSYPIHEETVKDLQASGRLERLAADLGERLRIRVSLLR